MPKMHHIQKIHFIGIGGIGMSGLAEILLYEGYKISGSDIKPSLITKRLIDLNIQIYFTHCPQNINHANIIVISSAISSNNIEVIAAQKMKIPVIKRAEMLAELMRFRYSIMVAGTHGKTTTTAMLVNIYHEAGLDPTFINGGIIKQYNTHVHLGCSRYLIAEADESDASFLYYKPMAIIITNIDNDHINTYHGNFNSLKLAFINFIHNLPFYGYVIMCIDDIVIRKLIFQIKRKVITYGFSNDADVRIYQHYQSGMQSTFVLIRKNKFYLYVTLNIPGRHNVLNATAAITLASEEDINLKYINKAISNFSGIVRRFDNLGYYNLLNINGKIGTMMLIDDYGHHPTEIQFTIETIKHSWPDKRLIMIFQPHRYTRTYNLYHIFVHTLSNVDVLLILDIDSAGEPPILGIDSNSLCKSICKLGKVSPILISDINSLLLHLENVLQNNDLVLIQGAGTIEKVTKTLIQTYKT